ncbi:hypothetical protein [Calycomorphotria hydatis]|uniref:Uncharacterized protein n=1 Tax=Calycomorphotria hydatis TaxID=2528027 RepID=A0A517T5L8_9PLAN|nr:hypothetical protein [Calycomorphotria hydatis]QDT63667.1 hypothetical protein V22_08910 [Calycomorphotria hydatis]
MRTLCMTASFCAAVMICSGCSALLPRELAGKNCDGGCDGASCKSAKVSLFSGLKSDGESDCQQCGWETCGPNCSPVGCQQKCYKGLLWPPYPRPRQKPDHAKIFHAAKYWPYPYVCEDREYIRNLITVQQQNGWLEAVTLYGYHFNPETHHLTDAGKVHLAWILHYAPEQQRQVYVQSAIDPIVSEARLANVETEAREMTGVEGDFPIQLRTTLPHGRPANQVDAIHRSEISTMPPPQITYTPPASTN